ncbi:hypothetical protein BT96DRAFT_780221, partial [Gymnopus androsaceus JB14]
QSHTGKALAETLLKVATNYGIKKRVVSITCNNATSNDSMVAELVFDLPSFEGE